MTPEVRKADVLWAKAVDDVIGAMRSELLRFNSRWLTPCPELTAFFDALAADTTIETTVKSWLPDAVRAFATTHVPHRGLCSHMHMALISVGAMRESKVTGETYGKILRRDLVEFQKFIRRRS